MSKGLEPCHRNVAVSLYLGAGGRLPRVSHCLSQYFNTKADTPPQAQLECNRVSLILQLAGRET